MMGISNKSMWETSPDVEMTGVVRDCPKNYRRVKRVVDSGLSLSISKLSNVNCSFGFTLLEVLVSLAIIAFALTAILKTQFYNLRTCAESKNIFIVRMLAQKKMAEIELSDELKAEEGVFPENKDFSYTVRFDEVEKNLKEVNLKIIYREGNLRKDFYITTLVTTEK